MLPPRFAEGRRSDRSRIRAAGSSLSLLSGAAQRRPVDAGDREEYRDGHHEAGKDEVGGWIVARDHMTDTHQRVTTFGNDAHGNEEGCVAIDVGCAAEESSGHREIEDPGDLDLPDVE